MSEFVVDQNNGDLDQARRKQQWTRAREVYNDAVDANTRGDWQRAVEGFRDAREIYRLWGPDSAVQSATQQLNFALLAHLQHESCLEDLTNETKAAAASQDVEYEIFCLGQLGGLYNTVGHYELARGALEKAVNYYQRTDRAKYGMSVHTLGDTYRQIGLVDKAREAYHASRSEFSELGIRDWYAHSTMHLANTYNLADPGAESLYGEALAVYTELGLREKMMRCKGNLALIHQARREYPAAERLLLENQKYFETSSDTASLAENAALLGDLYAEWGLIGKAGKFHDAALEVYLQSGLYDRAANVDANRSIAWLRRTYPDSPRFADVVRYVLKSLLPSLLYQDARRHQFGTTAERIAWQARYHANINMIFDLADRIGDTELVADLVELSVNTCAYRSATAEEYAHSDVICMRAVDHVEEANASLSMDQVAVAMTLAGGAARLVSGARLPTQPSPPLRLPNGHIVLDEYFRIAETRYQSVAGQLDGAIDVVVPFRSEAHPIMPITGDRPLPKRGSWFRRRRTM